MYGLGAYAPISANPPVAVGFKKSGLLGLVLMKLTVPLLCQLLSILILFELTPSVSLDDMLFSTVVVSHVTNPCPLFHEVTYKNCTSSP